MPASLTTARVMIVSGKGGVGKTTVAASLALAASRAGRRTLLVELEAREGIAPLFGLDALGYEERTLAPNLTGLSVAPDKALAEYLAMFYRIRRIGRALSTSKAVDFATNTAPGLRDILLIGKVKEAETRRTGHARAFDLVVVDAPPTGRLPRFLDAPRAVADLVRGGPIRTQALAVLRMVADPARCRVALVVLPEEMPVRETVEAAETIEKMGIRLGPIVLNALWPAPPPLGADPERRIADAARAGLDLEEEAVRRLAGVAGVCARRAAGQAAAVAELERLLEHPRFRLPYLFTPSVGPAEVERLAGMLAGQGAIA